MYLPLQKWHQREKVVGCHGYILIRVPEHPKAFPLDGFGRGWYYEHRLVLEKHFGRILRSWEECHHISEDKTDNREHNLFLCVRAQHERANNRKA